MLFTSFCVWLLLLDVSLACLVHYRGYRRYEREQHGEQSMQQDTSTQIIDAESSAYVTLLVVQREVGVSCGTLKKYLTYLGIVPICFHIGTRSLYISREAMDQVKRLSRIQRCLLSCRP
jgi:hypothetical protein